LYLPIDFVELVLVCITEIWACAAYMSCNRMLERSKALEASERSIAASILRGLLCKVLFALLDPLFNSEDPNARWIWTPLNLVVNVLKNSSQTRVRVGASELDLTILAQRSLCGRWCANALCYSSSGFTIR
jgi:hypothetical protein